NINCRCFDPTTTAVLNPNAWQSIPAGVFAADQTTIRNFRGIRTPQENMNISRTFQIKERFKLQIRAEFTNAFNRLQLSQPQAGNTALFQTGITSSFPLLSPASPVYTSGFGTFSGSGASIKSSGTGLSRSGTLIARLQF